MGEILLEDSHQFTSHILSDINKILRGIFTGYSANGYYGNFCQVFTQTIVAVFSAIKPNNDLRGQKGNGW